MGIFDHLIPKGAAPPDPSPMPVGKSVAEDVDPPPRVGMFDHLIPKVAEAKLDFTKPVEEIRSYIASLPESKRKAAQDAWADYRVANSKSRLPMLPEPAKGIPIVGSLIDEMVGGAQAGVHAITGGKLGAPYDEAVAEERARDRAIRKKYPVATPVAEIVTGMATAGPLLSRLTPAKSVSGQAVQGALVGGPLAAAEGFLSEGSVEDRLKRAGEMFGPGVAIGAGAPIVLRGIGSAVEKGADLMSPQLARAGAYFGGLRDRLAVKSNAFESPPQTGAEAAADQIIANQLTRANVTVPQLRERFAAADEAARMGSNSRAQNLLAPVDIDPSLQRLAGSVARQQPEADTLGKSFQYARQTGQPSGLPLPAETMVPTRPAMARPGPNDPPVGQFERITDALKRALAIEDSALHGHGKTGYATEQLIIKRARAEADDLYGRAYAAAEGAGLDAVTPKVSVRPYIEPVLAKWATVAADEPPAVAHAMRTFLRQFSAQTGPVGDLRQFQKAKEFADGVIEQWMKGPNRNKYVGGQLAEIQRDLLGAVDNIQTNGVGTAYKAARDAFAGEMQLRDALKLGRDTLREDSEVVVDQFRQLATESERKLFRLGLWEGFRQMAARKGRGDDITRLFANPRVQEIMAEVIPRSRGADAVFANRPERFGEYLANEGRMIQTRNQTMGNSKTAERLADDEALNNMQSMIEAAKRSAASPSASGFIVNIMEAALSKLFGFRADTAAAIARQLYTASPREREMLLARIEARMGPGRAAEFARAMSEMSQAPGQSIVRGSTAHERE